MPLLAEAAALEFRGAVFAERSEAGFDLGFRFARPAVLGWVLYHEGFRRRD